MVEGHGGRFHHKAPAGTHPKETRSRVGMEGGRKISAQEPQSRQKLNFKNLVRKLRQRKRVRKQAAQLLSSAPAAVARPK